METKKFYVIFGGGGFIGSNICDNLLDENSHFLIIDLENNKFNLEKLHVFKPKEEVIDRFDLIKSNVTFKYFDLSFTDSEDQTRLDTLFWDWFINIKNVDLLKDKTPELHFINLASIVGVSRNLTSNFDAEMRITQNVCKFIKLVLADLILPEFYSVRIWYTSTSELYGDNSEKLVRNPHLSDSYIDLSALYIPEYSERSHYIYQKFLSKKIFEELGLYIQNKYKETKEYMNIDVNILTLFNVVGPLQDPKNGVFNKFIHNILTGYPGTVCSNSVRRYVPVNEVTNVITNVKLSKYHRQQFNNTFITGNDHHFAGTGGELYQILTLALLELYPTAAYIINKAAYTNTVSSKPEIKNRFKSNAKNYSVEKFIEIYGELIQEQVKYATIVGYIKPEIVGLNNFNKHDIISEDIRYKIEGKVIEVDKNTGLVIINGMSDYKPGTIIGADGQPDFNALLATIIGETSINGVNVKIWQAVVLGKTDNLEKILNTKVFFKKALKLPNEK